MMWYANMSFYEYYIHKKSNFQKDGATMGLRKAIKVHGGYITRDQEIENVR